ncbi:MAG: hypothetical protein HY072_07215 [Deltaproteobacteria bacterium]|nr:hypothetical protein [Deltaproteobacteria bacterium]
MSKLELKKVLDELELKKPMRLMQGNPRFQEPAVPISELVAPDPALPLSGSKLLNLEETGIKMDRVENGPGLKQTGSKIDPVQNEPCPKSTGSKKDPVAPVGNSATGETDVVPSKNRLPLIFHIGVLKPRDHYTAIPNRLLRDVSAFDDPNDFMIYLRMFSLSFGFGRNTCDMGMAELLAFTRLGKNAIRRSLERLITQGWIKKVNDFEAGQVPRKWRIFTPCEKGLTSEPLASNLQGPKSTGSKMDPVQKRPRGGPKQTR